MSPSSSAPSFKSQKSNQVFQSPLFAILAHRKRQLGLTLLCYEPPSPPYIAFTWRLFSHDCGLHPQPAQKKRTYWNLFEKNLLDEKLLFLESGRWRVLRERIKNECNLWSKTLSKHQQYTHRDSRRSTTTTIIKTTWNIGLGKNNKYLIIDYIFLIYFI